MGSGDGPTLVAGPVGFSTMVHMTVNDILIGVIALICIFGGIGMVGALVAMSKSGYRG